MTKTQLAHALAKFPEVIDIHVQIGDRLLPLDHVEMRVDSTPQTIEASGGAESWQQLLVNRIQVVLVGKPAGVAGKEDGR